MAAARQMSMILARMCKGALGCWVVLAKQEWQRSILDVQLKAGEAVTWITQKAVELLGPMGYSRELLVEKWMRDAKINDIYEGTKQINTLIVARSILGYTRHQLK